jgi:cation diffusion facilitator family transporter
MSDPASAPSPRDPVDAPERIALLGIVANAALAGLKLLAGIFGNSFALVADAVESMADIAGSVVIWGALKYGRRPPDDEHPFGHGKAEALAALAVACLIIVAGLGIGAESVRQIRSPQPAPAPFTLIVLLGVIVTKEVLFRIARRAAGQAGSSAGRADAWHHRSDAITSLFALLGISIALIGGPGWEIADAIAALGASVIIMINGLRLVPEPYHELIDRNDAEVARLCAEAALSIDGIDAIERCEARKSGRTYRVVMHAEVDPEMSVKDAHDLTGMIKTAVAAKVPRAISVLVHVEPSGQRIGADQGGA